MNPPEPICILLHAHLPYGLRCELPMSLEESWLHEAVLDCYLPLLELIEKLPGGGTGPKLAVSLSPTLLEMWAHPEFPNRFNAHLERLEVIFHAEATNGELPAPRRALAASYGQNCAQRRAQFQALPNGLADAFANGCRGGSIELLTTAATHAFLPAYQNAVTRRFQIELGVERFTELTGIVPKGFWLPECGYYPGLEIDLATAGIEWFGVENLGQDAVTRCPNGVMAIARDPGLSRKVWDAQTGYPGNAVYREFHQDAASKLPDKLLGDYRLPDGQAMPLGLKYWRVTGAADKEWYDPAAARAQASADARDFRNALDQARGGAFLPFDAELFGHWWHEGVHWLAELLQEGEGADAKSAFLTPSSALSKKPDIIVSQPPTSTWGQHADNSFWVNHETDWIFPLLTRADQRIASFLDQSEFRNPKPKIRARTLAQAMRELLLAQASDWPFMVRAGATADYAREQVQRRLARFHFLIDQLETGKFDEAALSAIEMLDPILPNLTAARLTE